MGSEMCIRDRPRRTRDGHASAPAGPIARPVFSFAGQEVIHTVTLIGFMGNCATARCALARIDVGVCSYTLSYACQEPVAKEAGNRYAPGSAHRGAGAEAATGRSDQVHYPP